MGSPTYTPRFSPAVTREAGTEHCPTAIQNPAGDCTATGAARKGKGKARETALNHKVEGSEVHPRAPGLDNLALACLRS